MLKIFMARPVADSMRPGGNKVRSVNVHEIEGSFSKKFQQDAADAVWIFGTRIKGGKEIMIRAEHIAWIEGEE